MSSCDSWYRLIAAFILYLDRWKHWSCLACTSIRFVLHHSCCKNFTSWCVLLLVGALTTDECEFFFLCVKTLYLSKFSHANLQVGIYFSRELFLWVRLFQLSTTITEMFTWPLSTVMQITAYTLCTCWTWANFRKAHLSLCQWFLQALNSTDTIRLVRNIVEISRDMNLTHIHFIHQVGTPAINWELIPLGSTQLLWTVLSFSANLLPWAISIYQF